MDSKWANGALHVYAHVTLTLRTILHVDGETTLWITTTSDPYCCQLNQRYTTCYMEQPHNCNEQRVSQPPWTDVTGLSDDRIVLQKGKKVRPVCRLIGSRSRSPHSTPGKHWRSGLSGLFDGLGEECVSPAVGSSSSWRCRTTVKQLHGSSHHVSTANELDYISPPEACSV